MAVTKEEQTYLSDRLEEEAALLRNEKVKLMLLDLDSEKMCNNIEGKLNSKQKDEMSAYHHKHVSSYGYVAAAVFFKTHRSS